MLLEINLVKIQILCKIFTEMKKDLTPCLNSAQVPTDVNINIEQ